MESQVKFRWRQRPPKLGYEEYERIAGRMQRCLERELPRRPWRKTLRVRVNADSRAGSDKKAPLVMWVIAPNAIDAFWAASLMGLFHKHVVAANRRIGRIAITAQREPVSGYAPLISWRFYGSDNRPKTIRDSELHGFVRYLHWCAAAGSKVRGLEKHGTEMLMHIAKSPSIQWEAVHGLAHHAERQGYLTCTPVMWQQRLCVERQAEVWWKSVDASEVEITRPSSMDWTILRGGEGWTLCILGSLKH